MPKKNEKRVPIRVTANFEVTFTHMVSEEDFKKLDADEMSIDEVVDDSIAYGHLATEGNCDFEWDYAAPVKPLKSKAKKK
jgi:hypothetical protein